MRQVSPYRPVNSPAAVSAGDDFVFSDATGTTDLWVYWTATRKRGWLVACCFLAFTCLAVASIMEKEATYSSTLTLLIQNQGPNITGVPEALGTAAIGRGETDYYTTQLNLLTSRRLAARVISDLGLENDPNFRHPQTFMVRLKAGVSALVRPVVQGLKSLVAPQEAAPPVGPGGFELGVHPDLVDRYLSMVGVSGIRDSQLVNVQATTVNPALSKRIANTHAATFIRTSLETRFELTTEARQFLEEKLNELKGKVEVSEEALNAFRKRYGIVSVEKGENLVVERLMALNRELTEARARRIDLESLYHVVQKRDNRVLSQVIDNRFIQQLKDHIANLEIEYARLATKFKPTYPRLLALQEQIDQARVRLERELGRIVRTIEADYGAAQAKEEALAQEMENQKKGALEVREKVIQYTILEREVESNRELYENVLKRTKETQLAGEVPISNMRITDRAEIPVRPDNRHEARDLILSMVLGLLTGAGLALALDYLDPSLRTPEDVGRFLRLPTLGMVPDVRRIDVRAYGGAGRPGGQNGPETRASNGRTGHRGELVVSHHPLSIVAESYRVIRTAILFSRPEKPPQTILVSSARPREGKTVTAINLAASMAQSGVSVLLIDADLRNGHCHRRLGLVNGHGLTNVLAGMGDPKEFIIKTSVKDLYFLPRGELSPNPAELLGSQKMRRTLEVLSQSFAFVILDSAPVLPIIDTALLSTMVDGVVLVARGQEVSRHSVRKARERLDYVNAKILGVVLNGVDIGSPEYCDYRHEYTSYYKSYARPSSE